MNSSYMPFHSNIAKIQQQTGKKVKDYIYNYSDLIGKGNFARVYKGMNEKTKQIVAIKIVSLDSLKSRRLQELIFEQIRILQQMNHPNILKFYEALMSQRNCYIITELCNEGNLEEAIKSKHCFLEIEIQSIVSDLYQGLKYLREMKVTHRDLKSANIFMHNGKAKIADFGLAKFYKETFKDLDIGSPLYMSPEGLIYNVYGEKTDVWAFGIIIYEMLHGQTPFCHCLTEYDIKSSVTKPLRDCAFKKNISQNLKRFIQWLLEIQQSKRPSIYQVGEDPYMKSILYPNQQFNKIQTYIQSPNVRYNVNMNMNSPIQQQQLQHSPMINPFCNPQIPQMKDAPLMVSPTLTKNNTHFEQVKTPIGSRPNSQLMKEPMRHLNPPNSSLTKSYEFNKSLGKDAVNSAREEKKEDGIKQCPPSQFKILNLPVANEHLQTSPQSSKFVWKNINSNEFIQYRQRGSVLQNSPSCKKSEFSEQTVQSSKESQGELLNSNNGDIFNS